MIFASVPFFEPRTIDAQTHSQSIDHHDHCFPPHFCFTYVRTMMLSDWSSRETSIVTSKILRGLRGEQANTKEFSG